jgi:tetratricopeptide (TPR) repeat protein
MNQSFKTVGAVGVGAALAVVAGLPAWGANRITLTNGKTIDARSIQWRASEQSYRVETEEGIIPVPKAQVENLEIDKPADLDKATAMISARQYAQAIPILDEIVSKYNMLVWDNEARRLQGVAYLAQNDPKKAADALEGYVANAAKDEVALDVMTLYWTAMLKAGRTATLKKALDEAVVSNVRATAAAATLMRGNMSREASQREAALLDYLRVVILFDSVKQIQPEALFKAAEVLDELRDPRADVLKRRLTQEYKDSEYAAKLGGKI